MSYHTQITNDQRAILEKQLDSFATFYWGTHNMWTEFGAFIINDKKGSLQFYNGPSFSNTYAKPQFSSANNILTGVTFNTQTISFTIGVYWFSIDEYRRLLQVLHPYEIDDLSFTFAEKWAYRVKLSSISDSTRHIIGNENGDPRYYTELKLKFDVQGPACVHARATYMFDQDTAVASATHRVLFVKDNEFAYSPDLSTPVDIRVALPVSNIDSLATVTCKVKYQNQELVLFDVSLGDLTFNEVTVTDEDIITTPVFHLHYMSEQGLLLLEKGDMGEVLTLHTSANGKRIVKYLFVSSFMIPGVLDFGVSEDFIKQLQFDFSTNNLTLIETPIIEAFARTNVI